MAAHDMHEASRTPSQGRKLEPRQAVGRSGRDAIGVRSSPSDAIAEKNADAGIASCRDCDIEAIAHGVEPLQQRLRPARWAREQRSSISRRGQSLEDVQHGFGRRAVAQIQLDCVSCVSEAELRSEWLHRRIGVPTSLACSDPSQVRTSCHVGGLPGLYRAG